MQLSPSVKLLATWESSLTRRSTWKPMLNPFVAQPTFSCALSAPCIRRMFSQRVAEQLTYAFITLRLDTCNSLLSGLLDMLIKKLQMIQNAASRMVTRTRKYDHVSPVLLQLHWLPIKKRVFFKILLLTCKTLRGLPPGYVADMLDLYSLARSLRSAGQYLLSVPRISLNKCGNRAFSAAAPRL